MFIARLRLSLASTVDVSESHGAYYKTFLSDLLSEIYLVDRYNLIPPFQSLCIPPGSFNSRIHLLFLRVGSVYEENVRPLLCAMYIYFVRFYRLSLEAALSENLFDSSFSNMT